MVLTEASSEEDCDTEKKEKVRIFAYYKRFPVLIDSPSSALGTHDFATAFRRGTFEENEGLMPKRRCTFLVPFLPPLTFLKRAHTQ